MVVFGVFVPRGGFWEPVGTGEKFFGVMEIFFWRCGVFGEGLKRRRKISQNSRVLSATPFPAGCLTTSAKHW